MHPDPDVVATAPRVGVEKTELALVVIDDRQLTPGDLKLHARHPGMEKRRVVGVHRVFTHLQPVAGRMDLPRHHLVARVVHHVEFGEGWLALDRTKIREHQPLVLDDRVGAVEQPLLDLAAGCLAGRVQDAPFVVETPGVVGTADAMGGNNAVFQRHASVAAVLVHQADVAGQVAVQHQVFPQDADRHGLVCQARGHHDWVPEAAQVLACWRTRPDPRQFIVDRSVLGLVIAAVDHVHCARVVTHGLLLRLPTSGSGCHSRI